MVEPVNNIVCTKLARGRKCFSLFKTPIFLAHDLCTLSICLFHVKFSSITIPKKFASPTRVSLQPSRQTMYLSIICLVWKRVLRNIKFVFFALSDNLFALNQLHTSLYSLLTISQNISISLCE